MAQTNLILFKEAGQYIPGGVNSPVRSFKAVGGIPIFVKSASGSKIYSEDNREFIDYCLSWGSLILGHANPKVVEQAKKAVDKGASFGAATILETELAKAITAAIPSMEKVRLTNSGTEAVMGAIRLARAFTGKDNVIKFENAYHGGADYLLDCQGVPEDFKKHTLTVPYNDINAAEEAIERHHKEIAAVIVEPVEANNGVIIPDAGFLSSLRNITNKRGIVLIFDEVITGFRLGYGGAQGIFGVRPDLTVLGKIIGGGFPIGAFGGRNDIVKLLAPQGNVYQAGTFSGNPVSVTAGLATLGILKQENPYPDLKQKTKKLCDAILKKAGESKIKIKIVSIESLFGISFDNKDLFNKFYRGMLNNGVYFSPSPSEANFLSAAHSKEDIDITIDLAGNIFKKLRS